MLHRRTPSPVRLLLAGLLWLVLALHCRAASGPGVRAEHGVVVAPEARAAAIGREVLEQGGNAVDAAVATALAIAVTFPEAGNLGGGGFLLYRTPDRQYHALDFREVAPRGLRADHFLDDQGEPVPDRSLRGGLAVGVPGTVAGLHEAHRRWGRLSWKHLVEPARRLARRGFATGHYTAASIGRAEAKLKGDPEAAALLLPQGRPLAPGERLVQSDLANTLRRIARRGPAGFYQGPVAEALVAAVRAGGGVMTLDDLAGYRPLSREPLVGSFRGHRVVTFPPPSSGGVALLQALGILERLGPAAAAGPLDVATLHRMAEIERRIFADRSEWLGDPDFFEVPIGGLLSDAYLDKRAATIRPDRTTVSTAIRAGLFEPVESPDTTHLSVGDAEGASVSMTVTLNGAFGNGVIAPGTGVLLNNEIDDFAVFPGRPNLYGLIGGEANKIEARKRPLSSMTPVIVEQRTPAQRPLLVLGSPGGSRIITSVLQVLVRVIDHGMPIQAAVDLPRVHHQWLPDMLFLEPDGLPQEVETGLVQLGHRLKRRSRPMGCVNAIGIDAAGRWIGAADPRRESVAAGY